MEDITAPQSVSGKADMTAQFVSGDTQPVANEFDFKSLISDEYKSHPSVQEYKDINGLVKSHIELNKMLGNSIRIPDENATPEQIEKFYSKLGRPENFEKYEFYNFDKLPDGFSINDEGVKQYKELAYKLGLSNKQAAELQKFYVEEAIKNYSSSYRTQEQVEEEFNNKGKVIFGDKFENVLNSTTKLLSDNLPEEQKQAIANLDNDSLLAVTCLLNNIQKRFLSQDTITTASYPANTAEDRKKELSELINKRDSMTKFDPNWNSVNEKINSMYKSGVKLFDN